MSDLSVEVVQKERLKMGDWVQGEILKTLKRVEVDDRALVGLRWRSVLREVRSIEETVLETMAQSGL